MSKCIDSKIGKYFLDYISSSLDSKKKEEFEDHLFYCDFCSKKVELFNNLKFIYKENREVIIRKYLKLDLLEKLDIHKIKEKEADLIKKVKKLAKNFIQEKYPDELPFFKMAWNALKDIQDIHLFNQKTIMSSLCITDTEVAEEELTVPIAIATIIITFRELEDNIDRIEKSELILKIENIAIKINATKKLAMELSKYIVEKIYKTENH